MKKNIFILLLCISLILGCQKEGIDGKNSLINIIEEPVGENCTFGGTKIITGIDQNNNNVLDVGEIQNTEYICKENITSGIYQININLYKNLGTGGIPSNDIYDGNIIEFNKINYSNIDSIKLAISNVFTGDPNTGLQAEKNISIELFDLTNDESINDSKIITDDIPSGQTQFSINIMDNIPNETINLGVYINEEDNCYFTIGTIDLIIWRH